ncbi:OmpA family protein [Variovorax terrae]|uniref:OmpA family protein n=1 Tax=Variovorax terrae TaxID=2923278 RepID=A0A9X1VUW1_9BURK|nr:OmpA family protein [Variovorax terrae]MCJ0763705.1 OmpA family protein [Variovorax terrae]
MTKNSPLARSLLLTSLVAALALAGCANMSETQKGTAIGAGVGTLAGVAIGDSKTGAAIGAAAGALGGYIWSKHMADKKAAMEQATAGTGVAVTQTPDNQLKLNIPSDVSFDTGRADIKPNLRPILDQFASGLSSQPNTEVRIIGHTDSTGTDAINDPLSMQRAASTRDYLTARGVDPNRVQISGRGSHEPVADNGTEAGRARNRRVEIFLAERAVAQGR